MQKTTCRIAEKGWSQFKAAGCVCGELALISASAIQLLWNAGNFLQAITKYISLIYGADNPVQFTEVLSTYSFNQRELAKCQEGGYIKIAQTTSLLPFPDFPMLDFATLMFLQGSFVWDFLDPFLS